jgi:hypothetical protein
VGVVLTPNPFLGCHRLPWNTKGLCSLAWHSRGRRGRERQLSTGSLPGKIPFHVAACDLSMSSAKGGCPAGNRGRRCSWGHPSPSPPTPPHTAQGIL